MTRKYYAVVNVPEKLDTIGIFEYTSQEGIDMETNTVYGVFDDKFKASKKADKWAKKYGYVVQRLPWKWDTTEIINGKIVKVASGKLGKTKPIEDVQPLIDILSMEINSLIQDMNNCKNVVSADTLAKEVEKKREEIKRLGGMENV